MLKETYIGNIRKIDPNAVIINVTRSAGSKLSPSWNLLNAYKAKKIDWNGYTSRFLQEMDNPECKAEMLRIGKLAGEAKGVYLVCYERTGNCHRFLLLDMIKEVMAREGAK